MKLQLTLKSLLLPLFSVLLLCGCATRALKYHDHPAVNKKALSPWDRPFSAIWINDSITNKVYAVDSVYVMPASVYLTDNHSAGETNAAIRMCTIFDNAFINSCEKLNVELVVDDKEISDIFVRPVIIDIEGTRSWISYCSLGTSLFVPYVSNFLDLFIAGEMTMAFKIYESSSDTELAIMVDSRKDKMTLFGSFRDYTRYGQHRRTARMWAKKLAELLEAPPGEGVKPPIWFTINPF